MRAMQRGGAAALPPRDHGSRPFQGSFPPRGFMYDEDLADLIVGDLHWNPALDVHAPWLGWVTSRR